MIANPPPPTALNRAVIIGGGAVGSHLASSLHPCIARLVIDPDDRVRAAFASRGINAAPPPLDVSLFQPGDVAILTTSAALASRATAHVPAWMSIISLTNGLTPDLTAARNGSLSHGVVEFAVSCRKPGSPTCTQRGWLTLERRALPGSTAWLANALDPRAQRVRLTNHIDAHRRSKLLLNASLDPVAAIIGGNIGDVFRLPAGFGAFRALLREALTVAHAAGWSLRAVQGVRPDVMSAIFSTPLVRSLAARSAGQRATAVASTLAREVARGELGEADNLCGAIVREGLKVNLPTPAHSRAMEILRRVAGEPGGNGGRPEFAKLLVQG